MGDTLNSNTIFKFARRGAGCLAGVLLALSPASAMMVSGGPGANEAAKRMGASGGAICLVDIMWEDEFEVGTGTLIRMDEKTGTGFVLTTAHAVLKFPAKPRAIALSFEANPVLALKRIFATGYVSHPDYRIQTKEGPDLAVIKFKLPAGFKADPMLLPEAEDLARFGKESPFLLGGYGMFALNGTGQGWDESKENGRVRRIGYCLAEFKAQDEAILKRDSFEGTYAMATEQDFLRASKGQPFHYKTGNHPMFSDKAFHEVLPTQVDSGAPLFVYDGESNRYKVIAVEATNAFIKRHGTNECSMVANYIALMPPVLHWIDAACQQEMPAAGANAKDRIMLNSVYNLKYKLNLTPRQVLGE